MTVCWWLGDSQRFSDVTAAVLPGGDRSVCSCCAGVAGFCQSELIVNLPLAHTIRDSRVARAAGLSLQPQRFHHPSLVRVAGQWIRWWGNVGVVLAQEGPSVISRSRCCFLLTVAACQVGSHTSQTRHPLTPPTLQQLCSRGCTTNSCHGMKEKRRQITA